MSPERRQRFIVWGAFVERVLFLVLLVLASVSRVAFVVAGAWGTFMLLIVAMGVRDDLRGRVPGEDES